MVVVEMFTQFLMQSTGMENNKNAVGKEQQEGLFGYSGGG